MLLQCGTARDGQTGKEGGGQELEEARERKLRDYDVERISAPHEESAPRSNNVLSVFSQ